MNLGSPNLVRAPNPYFIASVMRCVFNNSEGAGNIPFTICNMYDRIAPEEGGFVVYKVRLSNILAASGFST